MLAQRVEQFHAEGRQSNDRDIGMHLGLETQRCVPPIGGEIEAGWPLTAIVERRAVEHARDAISPDAAVDHTCEIPAATLQHETKRRDAALLLGAPTLVADLDQCPTQRRGGDGAQMLWFFRLAEPARRVEVKTLLHPAGILAQICRQ